METGEARGADVVQPFPRVIYVANGIELLERLAFYGVYINLSVYLLDTVKLTEVEMGTLLGLFALGRAWLPVGVGAVADRLSFRRSLFIAFALYTLAYLTLYASPERPFAYAAIFGMAVGGAFMKPVITGTISRYAPPGRTTAGFAIFYAMVNAGSVIGKVLAKQVRTHVSLRATMLTSVVASLCALAVVATLYFEPAKGAVAPRPGEEASSSPPREASTGTLQALLAAVRDPRLVAFLVLGENAPREYITLINPLSIALLQVPMARVTRRLDPVWAIALGILLGSVSMVTMGLFPTLYGAAGSFFLFALAEMTLSPHYYSYVASFAPEGKEGLFMGLALIPFGMGGLVGGVLAGRLLARYMPKTGPTSPLSLWGTYAAIGLACAVSIAVYRVLAGRRQPAA
jgi:dipeptide/tripeptide permease